MDDESLKKIAGSPKETADCTESPVVGAENAAQLESIAAMDTAPKTDLAKELEKVSALKMGPMTDLAKQLEKVGALKMGPMTDLAKQLEKVGALKMGPMTDMAKQLEKITAMNTGPMTDMAKQLEKITAANSTAFKESLGALAGAKFGGSLLGDPASFESIQAAAKSIIETQAKVGADFEASAVEAARTHARMLAPSFSRREDLFQPPPRIPTRAEVTVEVLLERIRRFERRLDAEHEVGMRLVTFAGEAYYVEDVREAGPEHVVLQATSPDGDPAELLQHYSQGNILLVALRKRHDVARRIGFQRAMEDEEDKARTEPTDGT